ncbi:IMPACT family protein [Desulfosarcina sp. OttesenSCG-928-A07]|nr:IMPACT family protein [Desulfosarcina sp. OttesenSCG-928-G17]MDL2329819.1 IMPACT family protein [Desulfosarcina sp. OttesenSCG-928-A07]
MFTLEQAIFYEEEVKKSRFKVHAAPVSDADAAMAFLEQVREARATHNCWAYRIHPVYRFSDDGEPGGTAGRPILSAIEKQGIDQVMVVVIRYFGGIKLGAGGLVRAYGGCVARCLQSATLVRLEVLETIRLKLGFDSIGSLYPVMERFGVEKTEETYLPDGVEITLQVNQDQRDAFLKAVGNASAGRARMKT